MQPPLASSIIDVIGGTPLVELRRLVAAHGLEGRLLAKLENLNPGHSKKDRAALEMMREARRGGALAEGQTVVELTSGNTGTGLAIVCRQWGHPFVAVMSRGNTPERARMMHAFGAEIVLVDQAPGSRVGHVTGEDLERVEARTRAIVRERAAFRADQFELVGNRLAHERHTGPELWEQSGGTVEAFVDFVGSGGTFSGVMRALRARKPDVRGYLVEPADARVLAGHGVVDPSHPIQGGGYSRSALPLLDRRLVSDYLGVDGEEAVRWARALAREEGILGGFSSGANLAAACGLLEGPERGRTVAFVVCDSGLKYLSTELFGG